MGQTIFIRWCGAMAAQLICNQWVAGSTPVTSSKKVLRYTVKITACIVGFLLYHSADIARNVRQIQEKTVLSNCVRLCSVCSACIRCAAGCHQSQKKPKLVVDKQRIRCYHIQAVCVTCKKNMGVFPSGQWGQTVNLLLSASVVRIHPRPPKKLNVLRCVELFVFLPAFSNAGGWIRTTSTRRKVRRATATTAAQRRKQGGAVGAAVSRTPVPPKA